MKGLKKTNFELAVAEKAPWELIYRKVWQSEDGEYFVKYNGETINVTNKKDNFIKA